ncbi:glycoside hydrolase family 44 protein [Emticicia sp. BO119]|uniref:glycoside hydrolase family 44 protein n=1 Tax=Emticicia sp. BO119 TaxID=2757768 RepID=UPI0015F09498|nr:glycoside hydrolase family 44 protein [Emticicia sp. BO119]MBA4849974.1 T9SS type A sorting domain-containing protein [Emticicia sp. BO119]
MKNLSILLILVSLSISAQVSIKIDPTKEVKPISPYLYGRNNSFSSSSPNEQLSAEELTRLRDAGVTFFRESGGNNSTKYNWRRKLSSHPDWYNNVYTNNWDNVAKNLQKNFPIAQGMWAFQLIGMAAKTNAYNFNDWSYNKSTWWEGVNQNLAGNGILNPIGTKAKTDGDPDLYLEKWPADSTTGILDHWFGVKGTGLDKSKIIYWNMDNEAEIWNGTHDDVVPKPIPAEEFLQKYFAVAKKAREKYPEIKLVGPVTANEWQWYNWPVAINHQGKNYPWLEYFIKRVAEEQKATGTKLLDVLDIHFYPTTTINEEIVQLHRVFFDRNYVYPGANGVKNVNGTWDNSQNKEYIFGRINDWLLRYFGANHGITLGLTEMGIEGDNANITAVWYASTMGEFMKNGVEIFSPWHWKPGMWETLHLFSNYNESISIKGESSNETLVSAYPSINSTQDSLTVVLVNRSATTNQSINLNFDNFILNSLQARALSLKSLPNSETFFSHTKNALSESNLTITDNKLNTSLPPLSVVSIQFTGKVGQATILGNNSEEVMSVKVFPNPSANKITIQWEGEIFEKIELIDVQGKKIYEQSIQKDSKTIELNHNLSEKVYFARLISSEKAIVKKIVIQK